MTLKLLKREQNGLNIELDPSNLVYKPSPVGITSKWQKNRKNFIFRLG